jgi:hypothetical protein
VRGALKEDYVGVKFWEPFGRPRAAYKITSAKEVTPEKYVRFLPLKIAILGPGSASKNGPPLPRMLFMLSFYF